MYRHFWKHCSIAEKIGIVAISIGFLLLLSGAEIPAAAVLAAYLLFCLVAPFMPGRGIFLPVISRGKSERRAIALSFDDGPHPGSTPEILEILAEHNIRASFFVTGKNAQKWPQLVTEIAKKGHELGNHSFSHNPWLMLKSLSGLEQEVIDTQKVLEQIGIRTFAFRPPVGISNPKLKKVLEQNSMFLVNFSCRGFDMGNKRLDSLSSRILKSLGPDDILLLHDIPPQDPLRKALFLEELNRTIRGAKARGLEILPLSELIQRQVMGSI